MKACPECGVILVDTEEKCPSCGKLLIQENDESAATAVIQKDVVAIDSFQEGSIDFTEVPVSKQIIVSPAPLSSKVGTVWYILFLLICLIPLLNLIVVSYIAFTKKANCGIRKVARYALVVIVIASIILIMILTKYNIKTLFINLRDYIMVVIRGISSR